VTASLILICAFQDELLEKVEGAILGLFAGSLELLPTHLEKLLRDLAAALAEGLKALAVRASCLIGRYSPKPVVVRGISVYPGLCSWRLVLQAKSSRRILNLIA
jgi:hypothetical protein